MCGDIEQGKSGKDSADLTSAERLSMALSFYDLQHTHIIHEKEPDTKVSTLGHARIATEIYKLRNDVMHVHLSL